MPQPKASTIVLLLALFACVALYVLGVGLGVQDETPSGESGMSEQERKNLRTRIFGAPPSVAPGALTATSGCVLSGGRVQVVPRSPCVVAVAESDERLRTLEVEPLGGSVVDLRLEFKGRVPVAIPVDELDEAQEFNVLGSGATVTLECRTPSAVGGCPVRLR